jgi:sodium/pantothenate symporter
MNGNTPTPGYGALLALIIVMAASAWLGELARRAVRRGTFVKGFFLGNRGLGAWALALTSTVQSGGTFMGFPALVFTYGWVGSLFIAAYMVVPLTAFGLVAKRVAHLSRQTGAITIPDLFSTRFQSRALGLATSLLILYCLFTTMLAQFKAGAIVMKLAFPGTGSLVLAEDAAGGLDTAYYAGLIIFTVIVVGYTMIGGFLASVWTDLFQSVLMIIGVTILFLLAIPAAGGLEQATRTAIANTDANYAFGPGYTGDFVDEPGESLRQFLPIQFALSYFFLWIFGGIGSPASVVRMMACKDSDTIRRSLVLLAIYNMFIYIPLIAICIAARAIMPEVGAKHADEIIPRMAFWATSGIPGGSLVAGLILAAPFGAVMATLSTYLVVIASGLVRDIYQRFIDPQATEQRIKWLTYAVILGIGLAGLAANIRPVRFLQALIVFASESAAATFCVPVFIACYWRRATATGTLAAMLTGAGTVLLLYILGTFGVGDPLFGPKTTFRPCNPLGLMPSVWGLAASLLAGVVVSLRTKPVDAKWLSSLFDVQPDATADSPAK